MHDYITCFLDDEGKSLMAKTDKHNEFEIFKRFMDWCNYKSGYLNWIYEQPSLKPAIESYVNNILLKEYINEYKTFKFNTFTFEIYITKLKPRNHLTYTKSLVIDIELYLEQNPNDKKIFHCIITDNDSLYPLDCLTL